MERRDKKGSLVLALLLVCMRLEAFIQAVEPLADNPEVVGMLSDQGISAASSEFSRTRERRVLHRRIVRGALVCSGIAIFLATRPLFITSPEPSREGAAPLPVVPMQEKGIVYTPVPAVLPITTPVPAVLPIAENAGYKILQAMYSKAKNVARWAGILGCNYFLHGLIQELCNRCLYPITRHFIRDEYAISTSLSWFISQQGIHKNTPYAIVSADLYDFIAELVAWDYESLSTCQIRSTDELTYTLSRLQRRLERIIGYVLSSQGYVSACERFLLEEIRPVMRQRSSDALQVWHSTIAAILIDDMQDADKTVKISEAYELLTQSVRQVCSLLLPVKVYRIAPWPVDITMRSLFESFIFETVVAKTTTV